jgi:hypothetical protein
MLTWNYYGWKRGKEDAEMDEFLQFNWNSTLFTMINVARIQSGTKDGEYVLVVVPSHLRGIIEPNIQLLEQNTLFEKDVIYRDKDEDVIEVNGVPIQVLNFSS